MTIELAQVAAGAPFAVSLALAGGITTLREGRRRAALNEALHELRRPLQVLSLSLPPDRKDGEAIRSCMELTAAALQRLDRAINGEGVPRSIGAVELGALLEASLVRWRRQAEMLRRPLRLHNSAGEARVAGEHFALAQGLDNLINNSLDHGSGPVAVEVRSEGRFAVLSVRDSGCAAGPKRMGLRTQLGGRCRRGHGLRLVRRVAREHGGSFSFRAGSRGSEAILRLPLQRSESAE